MIPIEVPPGNSFENCTVNKSIYNIGEMNLDHDFVQVSKLSEDQKRKVFNKTETLFPPNSGEDQKKKKEKTSPKMEHVFSPNSN